MDSTVFDQARNLFNTALEKVENNRLLDDLDFKHKLSLAKDISIFTIEQMILIAPDGIRKLKLKQVKKILEVQDYEY